MSLENKGELSVLKRAYLALEQKEAELAQLRSAMDRERLSREPIAIVGLSCRFPGEANDPESYWKLLWNGLDAVSEVPAGRWNTNAFYLPDGQVTAGRGGFLREIDGFDPEFFGISPRETVSLDPQQRLLLEVSWEALERSGEITDRLAGSPTGVFIGITSSDYAQLQMNSAVESGDIYSITGTALNAAAGRLSYTFGFQGPAVALDTACSSSLVAVHYACQSLRNGECSRALAGGVNLILLSAGTAALSRGRVLSPDGRCKAFDASADGMGRGEGCGVVVLKRLSDAVKERNPILALIRGSAVNQDGSSSGLTVPNGPSQETLIRAALDKAGLRGADIDYVEAHGTGTALGDPIEIKALGAVYGERRADQPLIVGSVKTNFGHLESAAGIAGLIKTVLALQHAAIPPHLHFRNPSTYIDWSGLPITVSTEPVPWPSRGKARRGAISAFGFSGTNAHVILEEYLSETTPAAGSTSEPEPNILTLSAKSPAALQELIGLYSRHIRENPDVPIADVCFTASTGRAQFHYRRAVSGAGADEICRKLEEPFTPQPSSLRTRVAFVFEPGSRQFPVQYQLAMLFRSWGVEPSVVSGEGASGCVAACLAGIFSPGDGQRLFDAWEKSREAFDEVAQSISYSLPVIRDASGADPGELVSAEYWIGRRTESAGIARSRRREFSSEYHLASGPPSGIVVGTTGPAGSPTLVILRIPAEKLDRASVLAALATLWQQGAAVDWTAFHRGFDRRRVVLPVYPFQRKPYWIEQPKSRTGDRVEGVPLRPEIADWLYRIAWKSKPAPSGARVSAHRLAAAAAADIRRLAGEIDADLFERGMASLEGIAIRFARRALGELGWPGEQQVPAVPEHQRLLARLIDIATEDAPGEDCSPEAILRLARMYPVMDAELRLLERCGSSLLRVLRGEVNALQLLFPPEGGLSASALYEHSPAARIANSAVGEVVSRFVDQAGAGRRLRVLEIGAGTGGTTASILPRLDADQTEYVFTDVSSWFLAQAREKFRRYPFVSYRVLDIELQPSAEQFDLIIAANVLHATRNLAESVRHARQMLRPGGSLILLEGTAPLRFIDLIFGLTEGWWRFADHQLRPAHALIDVPRWKQLLEQEGFAETSAIAGASGLFGRQAIIIGTATDSIAVQCAPGAAEGGGSENDHWIVFADRGAGEHVGESLSINLSERSRCTLVYAGESYREISDGIYEIDPQARDDYDRLLREVTPVSDLAASGVVHLWSLESESLPTIQETTRRACGSALLLAQALLSAAWKSIPPLWIVTRGAQPAGADAKLSMPGQAMSWGMARALALEHPELRCVLVDLDPETAAADQAARIANEIECHDGENQVAYRNAARVVARIHRYPSSAKPGVAIQPDRTYLITGGLSGLGLCVAQWLVRRGARHLVLMGRRGIPGSAEPALNEMAGKGVRVRAVRADVSQPSDVSAILQDIDTAFPPLGGVVHSAGVLDDGVLLQQSWPRFRTVMSAKVDGAWILHELTRERKLDFFVLFSSVAAFLGSAGQANHAAVNAFMDALAFYRRSQGLPGLSINWGAWSEIGSAGDDVAQRVRMKGLGTISPADGLQILDRLLSDDAVQAAVMPIDWPRFSSQFDRRPVPAFLSDLVRSRETTEPDDSLRAAAAAGDPGVLRDLRPEERAERLESYIRHEAAAVLRLAASQVDVHQPLNGLGLDSLMALELRHRVRDRLDMEIPLVAFMAGSSVSDLASRIASALESGKTAAEPAAPSAQAAPSAASGIDAPPQSEVVHALSYGQKALWFIHQSAPRSPAYNAAFSARIRSRLDPSLVRGAFQKLVERHESLRTTFERRGGEIVQVVHGSRELQFEEIEAANCTPEELKTRVAEAHRRPFDLETGPLLRVTLFRCGPEDHVLLLTIHHIVCDGWSIWVMVDEFRRIYDAQAAGTVPALKSGETQYADFARWQDKMLAGDQGRRLWDYWRQQLAGALPVLNLPTDRPRPPVRAASGASYSFDVESALVEKLFQLCRTEGATLYMVCAAAFQVLLHRYTNQDEIIIGSPANGRGLPEFAQTVGYLVNPIVLRGRLSANQSFREFLGETRKVVLAAIEHQDFPFPLLVERLHPPRDPSRAPLFQVLFLLQKPHDAVVEMEPFEIPQLEGQFDLALDLLQSDGAIHGVLRYDTSLFEPRTILQIKEHFENILRSAVSNPEVRLGDIPLLTDAENHRVLHEWNDTAVDYPQDRCLHEFIAAQARRSPGATALICGDEQLSYAGLNGRANQLAARLRRLGAGPDVLVGVCMERSVDMVVALLGILKSGGAYVPLDPEYPQDRLTFMAKDAHCGIVLSHTRFASLLQNVDSQVLFLDLEGDRLAAESDRDLPVTTDPRNLAYMIYTSGSTGAPKGAMNTHRGICNRLLWMQDAYGLTPADRVLQKTPFSFDVSVWEFFWPLMAGACLVMARPGGHRDSGYLVRTIRALQISTIHFVPSMLQVFLEDPNVSQCHSLRRVIASGEAMTAEIERRFFQQLNKVELHNLYGPTEAAVDVTFWECRPGGSGASVPIGRPIANTQVYVLDRRLQPAPAGVAGELHIGGAGLARGYFNRPDLTAERFIPNPFSSGERLYRTGDLARCLPGGNIQFLGRIDHQVKVRGFRIEPGEIEAALVRHPGVKEAAVTVIDHPSSGRRLVAHVVCDSPGKVSREADLRRFLQSCLPEYMVPSSFVYHERLPLSANGKLDRRAIEDLQPSPIPDPQLPKTELQTKIAEVWKQVLGVDTIGLRENFFDLGGHSLLMNRVLYGLNSILPRPLALIDLFQYPTIHALAEFVAPQPGVEQGKADSRAAKSNHIAIVGMSGRFPGAANVAEFWTNLCNGAESITFFSNEELIRAGLDPALVGNPDYVPAGGILPDIDLFDAEFFDITPREAEGLDVQQRIFLECAWESLEDAGYDPARYPGSVGVYAGAGLNSYLLRNVSRNREVLESLGSFQVMIGNDKDFLPTRVSYKLNLKGPSVSVQTACSTSLVAVHFACAALANRECDMALAGGVSIRVPQTEGYLYQEGMILSPDGHCRAFDRKARGTIGGSGAGVVILKRLDDALADGDRIRAVILGSAINNDGSLKVGYTAPSVQGQQAVISQAFTAAGVTPEDIGYIEAHGTGTPLGDPIEVRALAGVFCAAGSNGSCALGSVKTNIGHLDAAAGVAGLIKTVLALEHQAIPPSLHFDEANPEIDFSAIPFYVNTALREWKTNGKRRRAGVSSFGIGGTNAHVVLEEAPSEYATAAAAPGESGPAVSLLVLSGRSSAALDNVAANLARHLRENPELNIADVAYTLQVGRRAFSHRFAAVCGDTKSAVELLRQREARGVPAGKCENGSPPVAFMFSGQGAQYVGMGLDLYTEHRVFRDCVNRCSSVLESEMGLDVRQILYPPSSERESRSKELGRTVVTQPALFVVEYALAQLWLSWGVRPAAMIGHSIGEYVAACLAGVLSLEDALALVAARGRMMQQLPEGTMLAVQKPIAEIAPLPDGVSLAAVNAPASIVLSGKEADIADVAWRLERLNILCRRLRTSHAFHSRMMEPVMDSFVERVKRVRLHPPAIPYISNVSGTWITPEEATSPEYYAHHLRRTVQFSQGLVELLKMPQCVLLEVGPGRTLANLALQHLTSGAAGGSPAGRSDSIVASMGYSTDAEPDRNGSIQAAGRLWASGVDIDWNHFHSGRQGRRVSLPTYPFQRQRYWVEPSESSSAGGSAATGQTPGGVRNTAIADWFYVPSWKRSVLPRRADEQGDRLCWVILGSESDGRETFMELAVRLRERRHAVITVTPGPEFRRTSAGSYAINPRRAEDYEVLLDHVRNEHGLPDKILHLWTLHNPSGPALRLESLDRLLDAGFYSLLFLAQALGNEDPEHAIELVAVSSNMQEVTGNDLLSPEKAALLGPLKIIPKEYPNISCRSIDMDAAGGAGIVDILLSELQGGRADPVVAYRGSQRWVSTFEPVQLDRPAPAFRKHGVYVITGGFGGIGFALAGHLARTFAARLVLIGRSSPPREKLAGLEGLGSEVFAATADVADAEQMRSVLDRARARFGEIHGVIHAAGVPGAGIIQLKTREMADHVMSPKIRGAIVLDEVLRNNPLDFVVLMSSLTSVLAEVGQVDYCSANLFLDAFARHRRPNVPFIAVNWDTWREAGMAVNASVPDEIEPLRQARLREGILTPEGIDALGRILNSGLSQLIVSTRGLDLRLKQESRTHALPIRPEPGIAHARPKLQSEYAAPRSDTERALAGVWQSLFGVEKVGADDNFFELGGHSLSATQLLARIRDVLGVRLPVASVFEAPTIAQLASLVEARQIEHAERDAVDQILAEVDQLSEEEVKRELAGGASGNE